jgi:Tol biopolymer transport system component
MANPVWSPDGSELAYDALTKDQFQLWSLDLMPDTTGALQTVGHPRQITNGPGVDATSRPVFMTRDQTARIRDWLTLPSAHS